MKAKVLMCTLVASAGLFMGCDPKPVDPVVPPIQQEETFIKGADVSWCSEMEASGRKFYNAKGEGRDLFALMKESGLGAVRLRVWVNPSKFGYGAWCDKADVIAKAKRAKAQGLKVMVDFHYSDFFADPSRQTTPLDWKDMSLSELQQAVSVHTKEILQALKSEGVDVAWVQTGNEINSGMLWDSGKIDWNKDAKTRYNTFVQLHNTAYDAVKSVYSDASVIMHYAGTVKAAEWDGWFFKEVREAGAKFDMIGLSLYPDFSSWSSTESGVESNPNAAAAVSSLHTLFNVPVMVVETGFSSSDSALAARVMSDLVGRLSKIKGCSGVFYWEPEVDGKWKPSYYGTLGWQAYQMGAFTSDGKPGEAFAAFAAS